MIGNATSRETVQYSMAPAPPGGVTPGRKRFYASRLGVDEACLGGQDSVSDIVPPQAESGASPKAPWPGGGNLGRTSLAVISLSFRSPSPVTAAAAIAAEDTDLLPFSSPDIRGEGGGPHPSPFLIDDFLWDTPPFFPTALLPASTHLSTPPLSEVLGQPSIAPSEVLDSTADSLFPVPPGQPPVPSSTSLPEIGGLLTAQGNAKPAKSTPSTWQQVAGTSSPGAATVEELTLCTSVFSQTALSCKGKGTHLEPHYLHSWVLLARQVWDKGFSLSHKDSVIVWKEGEGVEEDEGSVGGEEDRLGGEGGKEKRKKEETREGLKLLLAGKLAQVGQQHSLAHASSQSVPSALAQRLAGTINALAERGSKKLRTAEPTQLNLSGHRSSFQPSSRSWAWPRQTPQGPESKTHAWQRVPCCRSAAESPPPLAAPQMVQQVTRSWKELALGRLVQAASALEQGNKELFLSTCGLLRPHARKNGTASQRVLHLLLNTLVLRAEGTGVHFLERLNSAPPSDLGKCIVWNYTALPFTMFDFVTLSSEILWKLAGQSHVHVVSVGHCILPFLPTLFKLLGSGKQARKLQAVRVTVITYSKILLRQRTKSHLLLWELSDLGARLRAVAAELGVQFEYQSLEVEEGHEATLRSIVARPGEATAVAIMGTLRFAPGPLKEGGDGALEETMRCLVGLRPRVVALAEADVDASREEFVPRFLNTAKYYWRQFESHDVVATEASRALFRGAELNCWGHTSCYILACHGRERRVLPRSAEGWRELFEEWGFREKAVAPSTVRAAKRVTRAYPRDFSVGQSGERVVLRFRGEAHCFMTSFVLENFV